MLRTRLIAAAGLIGPILMLIWLDDQIHFGRPGLWLVPLAVLFSQLACAETLALVTTHGPVSRLAAHVAALAVVICSAAPIAWRDYPDDCVLSKPGWALLGTALAFCVVAVDQIARYRESGQALSKVVNTWFAVFYSGVLMTFLLNLRMIDAPRKGLFALLSTIIVVKLSDSGAYFTGRAIGRHKMARLLSPKKTWEGAAGGIVTGCLGSLAVFYILRPWFYRDQIVANHVSVFTCVAFGASLTIAGMIGDLFESLLKREAQVKDSSRWLPGLGGTLDVLDSVLAAAPVSFAWWVTGLLG